MLMTLRTLRVIVGFITIWQIIGLLPVLTNWLPNANATTADMWAIAFIKFFVLLICSTAFYWLGRIKRRYEFADAPTSELPAIGGALAVVFVIGLVAAFIIPTLSKKSPHQSANTKLPIIQDPASKQIAGVSPAPEAGKWQCTIDGASQSMGLFLFPNSVVHMSVEPDKWALMDDLHWQSADHNLIDQSVNLLTVQLLSETQASIQWPAGETVACTH